MAFVLDTSVALAWVLTDEGNEAIDALCDRLRYERVLVPQIWPLEVGNALLVAVRRGRIAHEDMERLVSELAALPIEVDSDTGKQAFGEVLKLASRLGLSTYDAAYLELATRLKLPLATLDKDLRAACRTARVEVL
ncbi:MAG: type II toxin-antitoxin system VapC family toxin [Gammaproteobacteria bacterium]